MLHYIADDQITTALRALYTLNCPLILLVVELTLTTKEIPAYTEILERVKESNYDNRIEWTIDGYEGELPEEINTYRATESKVHPAATAI
jgi:hypothetical protein